MFFFFVILKYIFYAFYDINDLTGKGICNYHSLYQCLLYVIQSCLHTKLTKPLFVIIQTRQLSYNNYVMQISYLILSYETGSSSISQWHRIGGSADCYPDPPRKTFHSMLLVYSRGQCPEKLCVSNKWTLSRLTFYGKQQSIAPA